MVLFDCAPRFSISIVSSFSWDLQLSQEKTKAVLLQSLGGQARSIVVFSEVAYWVQQLAHLVYRKTLTD